MILELRDVTAGYGTEKVLREASLALPEGSFTALLGPNGAGKTTLLRVLLGLLAPHSGEALLRGKPVVLTPRLEVARAVALVAQEPVAAFAHTALEVVLMGRYPRRLSAWFDAEEDVAAARNALAVVNAAALESRIFATLSGGEQQRVAIAAALAQEPAALLLDEPTANLDLAAQVAVYDLLRDMSRSRRVSILAVTHDVSLAAMYCDRVALLDGGRIAACGTPAEVLRPETLTRIFGTPVAVATHPTSGTPVVLPIPGGDPR
ncbi:MAG: ABC transporter ATP-binding protein [Planctomycetes bacterium]|nr:ABC transporter ATP-binding protein [Planctomycetota bacterium]